MGILKECSTCQSYIFPPEDSKGRADIGRCGDDGAVMYESSVCGDWKKREEE